MAVDYLVPDFEPNFLTVSQLKKILLEHEVDFKPHQSKSELVDLFRQHVGLRAASNRAAPKRPVIEVRRTANPRLNRGTARVIDIFVHLNALLTPKTT